MCLIARLNLAINEQSEKFWYGYGINDKVSIWEYRKNRGRMGEYKEFERVWIVEKLGNFW